MAKSRNKKKTYRRRRGLRLLYLLMSFILIVSAILVSCVFFFRVEEIQILGNTRYSNEQVLTVANIGAEANLFLLPRTAIEKRISDSMPYVDSVNLKNKYPSTLILEIQECVPLAAFRTDNGYWLMDASGKVLEQVDESIASTLIQVEGVSLLDPKVGQPAQVPDEAKGKFAALCALLGSLQEHEIAADVSWIDMSGETDIEMGYLGRFTVRLPLRTEHSATEQGSEIYSLKIEALKKIVSQYLGETDRGIIDLWEDKGFFRPR